MSQCHGVAAVKEEIITEGNIIHHGSNLGSLVRGSGRTRDWALSLTFDTPNHL